MLGRGVKRRDPRKVKAKRDPRGLESGPEGFATSRRRKKERRNDRLTRVKRRRKRWKRGMCGSSL
jgi:hypothetical protein